MKNILKINTLIVDDEPHILKKVKTVIESTFEDYIIVGEKKNGRDALELINTRNIDLVITDIRMPEMSGLELAETLQMSHPHIKTIILTGHREFEYAKKAIQRKYILENYLQNITLAEIATKFNFSQAYLTKIFIKFTGVTPLKYKTSLRINAAKDYLAKTNMSVSDIAEQIGYSDQFAFSKAFKNSENMSPLQYRKSISSNSHSM
jgi:two-component system response regulator YesN